MQQQKQVSAGEGIASANVGGRSGGGGGGGAGGSGSVSVCRRSGSRWTPTPRQLRILKGLYCSYGVRSLSVEQIQRITSMLRPHGKIEDKNAFYWFQNHKARERQKKRLTNLDVNTPADGADINHLGILSLSPSGVTSPSSTLGMYTTGNCGASAMQLDTTADWDNTAIAIEGCFLQDYMGVRSTGGGHGGTGVATSPWSWFASSDQRMTTTRAPETLPLFPTSDDDNRPQRQGGRGGGSYYLPDLSFWGAAPAPAATATAATTTTTVTIQQHQQQYSFYSSNSNNQPPSHGTRDTAAGAGASLELSLSSSWCSPYHAGTM